MPQNILEMRDVSFAYPGGKPVLSHVSLEVKQNELIVLTGDSGSGKSTLLKLFNRFCDADSTKIFFHGRTLREYITESVRSTIIYLSQVPIMLDGTVEENLSFPFRLHAHRHKDFDPKKALKWLEYFQLDIPLQHNASKLSIGQQQRIALIRSILIEPEVLLLDEPCSSVDNKNKNVIEQNLESLIGSSGITVLLATHSSTDFKGSHRIMHLENGRLIPCTAE